MGQKLSTLYPDDAKMPDSPSFEAIIKMAVQLVIRKWYKDMKHIPAKDPVVVDRNGDMTKQWYVRYWYWSKKKQRIVSRKIVSIKGVLVPNREVDKAKRYEQFTIIREAAHQMVKAGWTPEDTFDPKFIREKVLGYKKEQVTLEDAFTQAFAKNPRLRQKGEDFLQWLKSNNIDISNPNHVKRKHMEEYLDHISQTKGLEGGTARNSTYNNYRGDLYTLFEIVVNKLDEDIMAKNPVVGIDRKKYKADRHRPYTMAEMKLIMQWCSKNQPYLRDYLLFIGYSFLRPIEILRLQVRDIDLEKKVIYLAADNAKTEVKTHVRIIDHLMPIVTKILDQTTNPNDYLFTRSKMPGPKRINKTTYFSDIFKNVRDLLNKHKGQNFTSEHSMYGTRHSFAGDIYKTLRKTMTKAQAMYELSLLMHHSSPDMTAKYVRDQGFELPEDYSDLYSLSFEK